MTTTSTTPAKSPALVISAGRAAAALECARKADGFEKAAQLLTKSIDRRSGNATLTIEKTEAIELAKAILRGFDAAALPGQRRGAAKKALSALIEKYRLSRADVGIAETKTPAPAPKATAAKSTPAKPKVDEPKATVTGPTTKQ